MSSSPPCDVELEQKVLSACLGYPMEAFNKVMHTLNPNDFYDPRHRAIYSAMGMLRAEDKPTDINLVYKQLRTTSQSDTAGGDVYLASLCGVISTGAYVVYHAKILKELSIRRKAANIYQEELRNVFSEVRSSNPAEAIQQAIVKLVDLQTEFVIGNQASTYEHINEGLQEALLDDNEQGYLTKFPLFDNITCGLQPSTLTIVAAAPGVGKTDLILNWALQIGQSIPALIFEMEIGKKHLKQRLAAMKSKNNSADIRRRALRDEMVKFINGGAFNKHYVYVDYSTGMTANDLRQKIAAFISVNGRCIVFLDHVQLLSHHTKHQSDEKNDSAKTAELKRISKEFDIPIVVLNHITKEGMKNKRPMLQDNKYAGAGDVDLAIFLWREDHQESEGKVNPMSQLELIIRKNRSGVCKTIYLVYDPTTGIMGEDVDQTKKSYKDENEY